MGQDWYYAQANQQFGPVPLQQLSAMISQGQVSLTDLVWTDGMANWVPAGNVPEIAQMAPAVMAASAVPTGQLNYYTPPFEYAGFWLRFVASIIDGMVVGIGMLVVIGLVAAANGWSLEDVPGGFFQLTQQLIGWPYFALMESSRRQATLGKMAMGLKVTDLEGNRITFGRATGRHFGKIISGFTCAIGYIMAGMTQRKQALHDMMASCLVIRAPR